MGFTLCSYAIGQNDFLEAIMSAKKCMQTVQGNGLKNMLLSEVLIRLWHTMTESKFSFSLTLWYFDIAYTIGCKGSFLNDLDITCAYGSVTSPHYIGIYS